MLSFIQKAIHDLATISKHCAVMFVDIDNFKTLNDTLGHRSGDLLLSEIANRINQVLEYAGCQRICNRKRNPDPMPQNAHHNHLGLYA